MHSSNCYFLKIGFIFFSKSLLIPCRCLLYFATSPNGNTWSLKRHNGSLKKKKTQQQKNKNQLTHTNKRLSAYGSALKGEENLNAFSCSLCSRPVLPGTELVWMTGRRGHSWRSIQRLKFLSFQHLCGSLGFLSLPKPVWKQSVDPRSVWHATGLMKLMQEPELRRYCSCALVWLKPVFVKAKQN